MPCILVLNAGSSSIKFASYRLEAGLPPALHGHLAQHAQGLELQVQAHGAGVLEQSTTPMAAFDCDLALNHLLAWLQAHAGEPVCGGALHAVGHRVVHGGAQFVQPVRISDAVLAQLALLNPLAPLHQPHNLHAIAVLHNQYPQLPQVACFDTAFHASQSAVARTLALPRQLSAQGIRRYGFHGLSYEYIASRLPAVLGDAAQGRVVVAHLGSGASLCALHRLRSVDSTMGFSALDGLVMGSRCGTLDPGVVLYLQQTLGLDAQAISDLLYHDSGLLGVSGISADMQSLLESSDANAQLAVDLFVYRAVCAIGSLAAALGGLDALVFTAGIGEHAAAIRARIVQGCAWLGARLDASANAAHALRIEAGDSRVQLAVIPTDEEAVIAAHTLCCLQDDGTL